MDLEKALGKQEALIEKLGTRLDVPTVPIAAVTQAQQAKLLTDHDRKINKLIGQNVGAGRRR